MKDLLYFVNLYPELFIIKNYKANTLIFKENEVCDRIGYLYKGLITISTYNTTKDEKEIINIIKENTFFGDFLINSNNPIYIGDVVSSKNSSVIFIKKANLINLMKDSDFCEYYLNNLCEKALINTIKNKLLIHNRLKDKLLFYFKREASINKSNTFKINISLIANELNTPRESVSREIKNLVNEGYITKNKKYITIYK